MEEMKVYYRAFREYKEKLAADAAHGALIKALQADPNACEGFSGRLSHCTWSDDWITAMLEALPYVERALAEQRKFIVSHEEIRRIDQARKTSVESVRHLAQHSNMISNVQGEDIIPDRVLIVERDDNYAIYENRFLYTLIKRMESFLDERYNAVAELNGASVHSFSMKRSATWNRKHLEASIEMNFEQRPQKARSDVAVEEMTSMERVNYLRSRVADLVSAPLMKLLKGVTPIAPPVVRTNVFKKNPNFKRALELFEYLENYRKPGYEIVTDTPEDKRLDAIFREELCEAVALESFLGRMNADSKLRQALEENFQLENELAEQERIRIEEERKRVVQERIAAARAEEIAIREAEIAKREEIIAKQNDLLDEKEARINELLAEMQATVQKHNGEIRRMKEEHAREISDMNMKYSEEILALKAYNEQARKEYAAELEAQRIAYEGRMKAQRESMASAHEKAIAEAHALAQEQFDRQEQSWMTKMEKQRAELERKSARVLARQKKEADGRINTLSQQLEESRRSLKKAESKLEERAEETGFKLRKLFGK